MTNMYLHGNGKRCTHFNGKGLANYRKCAQCKGKGSIPLTPRRIIINSLKTSQNQRQAQ
ncbi:DnaJ-class molecular chaperone [Sulfitobacter undariae]|uniref:DnaJ-class molecular chaperone n=1 Tax=Sulfitobacter undariae TaxID=1563671 RepID=A0A7W6E710_9RHOB|nr:DnaJ-class molecular chaperone [Sulfitobacter undariae]